MPGKGSERPQADARAHVPLVFKGKVHVGNLNHTRDQFEIFENPDLKALLVLTFATAEDIIIEASNGAEFSVLDCDTHHLTVKPADDELNIHINNIKPQPDAAFITHGKGIKSVYVGPHHRQRAALAALGVPPMFKVELAKNMRHPRSTRKGAKCGPVIWGTNDPNAPVVVKQFGRLSAASRDEALKQLGLEDGKRYDHTQCPIEPNAQSDATACVLVLGDIVYCHRCAAHGVVAGKNLKPGVFPLRKLVNDAGTVLEQLVWNRVHWYHARYVLANAYPHFGEGLLRETFRVALEAFLGTNDPRVNMVFNANLDFVRGESLWLRGDDFAPMVLENDDCTGLPGCLRVEADPDDSTTQLVKVIPTLRSKFKNRTPNGYVPIRPVRGVSLAPDDESVVTVQVPPFPKHKIELVKNPMSEDAALEIINGGFPGVYAPYLKGILAACICAEQGGKPPFLGALGPTGSAKNATIVLGQSFLGIPGSRIQLIDNAEEFFRQIGSELAAGQRAFTVDELGKVSDIIGKLQMLYQLDAQVSWRPLYGKSRVQTPGRAAYFFPTATVPEFLKSMAEFNRRVRFTRLYEQVDWEKSISDSGSKSGIAGWRDLCQRNADAANALVTHIFKLCHATNFVFTRVAEALGIGTLADDTERADPEIHRNLYRLARGEMPGRVIFEKHDNFVKGWLDLASPAAAKLIATLLDLDNFKDAKSAQKAVRANLEALPWNNILGIKSPPIRCRILIHGTHWGVRFQTFACLKGSELLNEQLPPIPGDPMASGVAAAVPTADAVNASTPAQPQSPPSLSAAIDPAEVLRQGGLPT
ncbi:MAG: hypothetical protein WCT04_09745 [Planctomycetota bacterium]